MVMMRVATSHQLAHDTHDDGLKNLIRLIGFPPPWAHSALAVRGSWMI